MTSLNSSWPNLVGLSFVELLFALIVALRRYKQMAASQKNGDVCVAIA